MSYDTGASAVRQTFEIGRVLSRAAATISHNFGVFAVLALLLVGLPHLALTVLGQGLFVGASWARQAQTGALASLASLLSLVTGSVLQAGVIHGVALDMTGRRASLGDCLNTALRHVLPLIGIGIVTAIGVILGLLVFIVPGIIFSLMWCVAAPVRVVEGLGVFGSISRSGDLTRNHRWALLLLFILALVGFVVLGAVSSVFSVIALIGGSPANVFGQSVTTLVVQTGGALLSAAGIASIYFELRTIKEGIGPEALAAAFD